MMMKTAEDRLDTPQTLRARRSCVGENDLHHLQFDRAKGWILRLTIEIDRRQVGKRVRIRCGTRDPERARWLRDAYLRTLSGVFGLRIRGHNGKIYTAADKDGAGSGAECRDDDDSADDAGGDPCRLQ